MNDNENRNRNNDPKDDDKDDNKGLVKREYFLNPGHIFYPLKPTMIYAVVGSGIAVTFYDKDNHKGLMCYAFLPDRDEYEPPIAVFLEPAVKGSLNLLLKSGSNKENIEVHVYGGAENKKALNYKSDISDKNINRVIDILNSQKISVVGMDVGGKRGRKIIFNSETGETATVKVGNIREHDWYPVA